MRKKNFFDFLLFAFLMTIPWKGFAQESTNPVTLVDWNFMHEYDYNNEDKIATPTATPSSLGNGASNSDRFYKVYPDAQLDGVNGVMSADGDGCYNSVQHANCNGDLTMRLYYAGQNNISDYTVSANHNNYFQFIFTTTGYQDIVANFSFASDGNAPTSLQLVYSVDGGTTWVDAGNYAKTVEPSVWWIFSDFSVPLPSAKDQGSVIVRLIGGNGAVSSQGCLNLKNFSITGEIKQAQMKETVIYQTNFDSNMWEPIAKSDEKVVQVQTYAGKYSIPFVFYKTEVNPTGVNTSKFSYTDGSGASGYNLATIGWAMTDKVPNTTPEAELPYMEIGPLSSVTGLSFVQCGTGSGRGYRVAVKGTEVKDGVETVISEYKLLYNEGIEKASGCEVAFNDINYKNVTFKFYPYITDANLSASGKNYENAYMSSLEIKGLVEMSAEQVKLSTEITPSSDAGTIMLTPAASEYDKGSTVTLSVTEQFGYKFKQWENSAGEVLSSEKQFDIVLEQDTLVKAVFDQVPTYALNVNVAGNEYGRVIISPNLNNGRYMSGDEVTVTAIQNDVIRFTHWSEDNDTQLEKKVVISEDTQLTANFSAMPYILAWDFYDPDIKKDREADCQSKSNNGAILSMVNDAGSQSWLAKGYGEYNGYAAAIKWQMLSDGYYFKTSKFSTADYTNVRLTCKMQSTYNTYKEQYVECSTDNGSTWDRLGTITFDEQKVWYSVDVELPAGEPSVMLRWIPNFDGETLGSSSDKDGTAIAQIYVFGEAVVVDDSNPPVLLSSVPEEGADGVSASGQIVLSFDERIQLNGTATLGVKELEGSVVNTTVIFPYQGLSYNMDYQFVLPAGTITDMSGNEFGELILNFTTAERVSPKAKLFDFIVAEDGSGDGTTIQDAFNAAAKAGGNSRFLILVKNGTYNAGEAVTELNTSNVSLIGQSQDGVIIKNSNGTGISTSSTIHIERNVTGFYAQDLTIQNGYDYTVNPQVAVALYDRSNKSVYKRVKLLSYQDTHVTGVDVRQYYEDCEIHGTVDFICGGGDIFYNRALLYLEDRTGNVITAPATSANCQYGYVFRDCTIDGHESNKSSYCLGRPWKDSPRSVFINTTMNLLPKAQGWTDMSAYPALFAEYNSMNKNGEPIDLENRTNTFTVNGIPQTMPYNPVLTKEEADRYTIENVLGGTDAWQPTLCTDQVSAPVISGSGSTVTWDAVPYAINYVIIRDGEIIGQTIETSYTDIESDGLSHVYQVVAANEYGGLSELSNRYEEVSTGVASSQKDEISVYADGARNLVVNASKGTMVYVYTINGALVHSVVMDAETYKMPLQQGSYIVRANSSSLSKSAKVIVR